MFPPRLGSGMGDPGGNSSFPSLHPPGESVLQGELQDAMELSPGKLPAETTPKLPKIPHLHSSAPAVHTSLQA